MMSAWVLVLGEVEVEVEVGVWEVGVSLVDLLVLVGFVFWERARTESRLARKAGGSLAFAFGDEGGEGAWSVCLAVSGLGCRCWSCGVVGVEEDDDVLVVAFCAWFSYTTANVAASISDPPSFATKALALFPMPGSSAS